MVINGAAFRQWKRSRWVWVLTAACGLAVVGTAAVFLTMPDTPAWDKTGPGYLDAKAVVSNEVQKRVVDSIGTLPQISDVYIAKTQDGKLVISASADLASGAAKETQKAGVVSQMSDLTRAMQLTEQFTEIVYELPLPIAQSVLNVADKGVYVASAALGARQEQTLGKSGLQWSSATAFADWLQQFQHEDRDLENNTFFYTASTLP